MGETKPNMYSRGKIYRLVCDDLTYYGSTIQSLSKRIGSHRVVFNKWIASNKPKSDFITSFKLFQIGTPKIFLVEDFPCIRKDQLEARERFFIENNQCVNKVIPGRTQNEWQKDNKERYNKLQADYRERNRDTIKVRSERIRNFHGSY